MNNSRWLDRSQPQTLYIAVIISYINVVFTILDLFGGTAGLPFVFILLWFIVPLLQGVSAFGIANSNLKMWFVAVALSVLSLFLIFYIYIIYSFFAVGLLGLIIDISMTILLLHPMSRSYVKIWFR